MKLIKIKEDHYVVVNETTQPVNGWYYDTFINKIRSTNGAEYGISKNCLQITHSTQPLEQFIDNEGIKRIGWTSIQPIELLEVKELIGEVEVEKKVKEYYEKNTTLNNPSSFKAGYNQALKDNKEKKYTDEDIDNAISWAINRGRDGKVTITDIDNFIQSLQPKTEWEVEIIDSKLKLK
jgi:hypothetical protein